MKESSDELNPLVITRGAGITRASGRKSPGDYFALAFATWGVGYSPVAPGTCGSAVGVGIYLLVRQASARAFAFATARGWSVEFLESSRTTLMLLLIGILAGIGVLAGARAEEVLGRQEPCGVGGV